MHPWPFVFIVGPIGFLAGGGPKFEVTPLIFVTFSVIFVKRRFDFLSDCI